MTTTAFAPAPAAAPVLTTWQIDPTHSEVGFSVKHLMITTVKGRFNDVKGHVRLEGDDLLTAEVDVMIGAASIDTRDANRDGHLKSADFFDVETFPTLTFKSRRVERAGTGHYALVGDITIHGVTREISLDVVDEGRARDPWGGDRAGFGLKGVISRKDFGLHWNQILEAGGLAVSDTVKLAIEAQLVKG
jgi:polyisoprenoid-binding protein YceI